MSKHLSSVLRLLKKKGNDDYSIVTITQTADPTNPLNVTNTPVSDSVQSFAGSFTKVDGDIIRSTDIKLYVDPSTVTTAPTISSKVTDGTITYNVQNIEVLKDQDTIAVYILQLRE